MQTSRECVKRALTGTGPDRIPVCLDFDQDHLNRAITESTLQDYTSDVIIVSSYDPEFVPVGEGYSQWGYKMETFGETMGEVKDRPLESWDNFHAWKSRLPDFSQERRYENVREIRQKYPDRYVVGGLGMMMEEIINLRGYANCMMDYYEEPEQLCQLIDCLYQIARQQIDGYAAAGLDGVIAWEDWGLQKGPMMSYSLWQEFYYDKMKDLVDYIHSKGMTYFLHSCGNILYLLDTFAEFGIDAIQMDQQMNMGLDRLSSWKGKLCFWCPVDIQHSVDMSLEEMGQYIHEMITSLGTEDGGFMYKAYPQPAAIHMPEEQLRREIHFMQSYRYMEKAHTVPVPLTD